MGIEEKVKVIKKWGWGKGEERKKERKKGGGGERN